MTPCCELTPGLSGLSPMRNRKPGILKRFWPGSRHDKNTPYAKAYNDPGHAGNPELQQQRSKPSNNSTTKNKEIQQRSGNDATLIQSSMERTRMKDKAKQRASTTAMNQTAATNKYDSKRDGTAGRQVTRQSGTRNRLSCR